MIVLVIDFLVSVAVVATIVVVGHHSLFVGVCDVVAVIAVVVAAVAAAVVVVSIFNVW